MVSRTLFSLHNLRQANQLKGSTISGAVVLFAIADMVTTDSPDSQKRFKRHGRRKRKGQNDKSIMLIWRQQQRLVVNPVTKSFSTCVSLVAPLALYQHHRVFSIASLLSRISITVSCLQLPTRPTYNLHHLSKSLLTAELIFIMILLGPHSSAWPIASRATTSNCLIATAIATAATRRQ